MVIDYEYLKKLLIKFEEHESMFVPIADLKVLTLKEKFVFHIEILKDYGFIQTYKLLPGHGAILVETNGIPTPEVDQCLSEICQPDFRLRLTAQGYDFLAMLKQKEFWEVFKSDLKTNSLETLLSAGKELAAGLLKAKVGKFISGEVD